jgi:hypothetical protein
MARNDTATILKEKLDEFPEELVVNAVQKIKELGDQA